MTTESDNTRIYVVTDKATGEQQLIRATSQSQAIRHAAEKVYSAKVASVDDIVAIAGEGVKVQKAAA
jgi:hypothetical protein